MSKVAAARPTCTPTGIATALMMGAVTLCACTAITERQTSAKSVPHASQDADIIVDRYRNDPKLGDDLFNDKTVEITRFRVDDVKEGELHMVDRGFTLVAEHSTTGKFEKGDELTLVCEGDGMRDDKTIAFEGCVTR